MKSTKTLSVEVVVYDPNWPIIYEVERDVLLATTSEFVALEHIGSTAIPGQRSKPVIDMMAAVVSLQTIGALLKRLNKLGYSVFEAGMQNRLFLRKQDAQTKQVFHLHIVEHVTWDERKERLMRDYLLAHPEAVEAYGKLKGTLTVQYSDNMEAYTRAKTAFIQDIMDKVMDARGLPRINVWED
jgi:GrpB-like predicted nucleotidyltransferase (UPF0157 family)